MAKKRNYKKEYEKYHKKKKQKKRRAQRNKSRRKLLKSGRVRKYDKMTFVYNSGGLDVLVSPKTSRYFRGFFISGILISSPVDLLKSPGACHLVASP